MAAREGQAVLAAMLQTTTVDLFRSFGIAVAPLTPNSLDARRLATEDLMGMIAFTSTAMNGALGLYVPKAVFELVRQDPTRPFTGNAWVQEAVNQLLGRIKARLLQFQVTLQLGLPNAVLPRDFAMITAQSSLIVYRFRTLRGEVTLSAHGRFDCSALDYSSKVSLMREGDVIVF
jgi:hypothetical protein